MRIISGVARGRQVRIPNGCRIRPTADRVKESLFALLEPLAGATFLDLFAGSGNVGLEALSRGAGSAIFVERNPRLAGAIRENLKVLGFETRGEVLTIEASDGLRSIETRGLRFDILFADPPYEEGYVGRVASWWSTGSLLNDKALCVLQHSHREPFPGLMPDATLRMVDQRRYGDTLLTFLTIEEEK